MPDNENLLTTYYDGVTERLQIEIDLLNGLISHAGEKGRANENALINLIVKFLPKRYTTGSGVIIDKEGNSSKQIDVIVYDSNFHPELFSQGAATTLYPVDVVYMTIEVKTTMTKDEMKKSIENIASVKRLNFIKSPIHKLIESPNTSELPSFIESKTSSPIGVIFAFDCDTTNFGTFESWIDFSSILKNELFDLCYVLRSTFFYTFEDLDRKDDVLKGIHLLSKAVKEKDGEFENIEDFQKYENDVRNPSVQFDGTKRLVDQGRGFLNFLSNLYDMLALKHVIQRGILRDYLTGHMLFQARRSRYPNRQS